VALEKVVLQYGEAPAGIKEVFELCRGFERAYTSFINVRRAAGWHLEACVGRGVEGVPAGGSGVLQGKPCIVWVEALGPSALVRVQFQLLLPEHVRPYWPKLAAAPLSTPACIVVTYQAEMPL
jgi:hypothetical protein